MRTKMIEIRDRATMIPALAIQLSKADGRLAWRSGYGDEPCVLLGKLTGGAFHHDPYNWGDRTMKAAHLYVEKHFDVLTDGEVIDAEYALGETPAPCKSEAGGASIARGRIVP